MRYFVKGEFIDTGAGLPPEQLASVVENVVVPSLESVARLEEEGKILISGVFSGERAGMFVVDVKSSDELTRLLQSLPFWALIKWDVKPLDSFSDRSQLERQFAERSREFRR